MGEGLARTLIVDTSSLDDYESSRAFYARRGFVEVQFLKFDAFAAGDQIPIGIFVGIVQTAPSVSQQSKSGAHGREKRCGADSYDMQAAA